MLTLFELVALGRGGYGYALDYCLCQSNRERFELRHRSANKFRVFPNPKSAKRNPLEKRG